MLEYIPKKKLLLLLGDIFLVVLAYFLAPIFRFRMFLFEPRDVYSSLLALVSIYMLCFYIGDLYGFELRARSSTYLFRFMVTNLVASMIALISILIMPSLSPSVGVFAVAAVLICVLTYLWHLVLSIIFRRVINVSRKILIIGAGENGYGILEEIKREPHFKVVGFIDNGFSKQLGSNNLGVIGNYVMLESICKEKDIDGIIIALNEIADSDLIKVLLRLKLSGVQIFDVPHFYEQFLGKMQVEYLNDSWLLSIPISGVSRNIYNTRIKRITGLLISILCVFISIPITVVAALAIKLSSKGPVFYKQKRVGLNGRIFDLLKFRSMYVNAEENGAVWAQRNDPRVTGVGRVIRKLRIDEIPQMWNVLKGDMHLFGPRPERPTFVAMLKEKIPYYDLRHSIKPGITGWAQVNYPYGASVEDAFEKLKFDLFYIKNLSFFLDFHVFLRTIRVLFFARGAR
jgi:sugar transferase (PEP-CTERM system associated)